MKYFYGQFNGEGFPNPDDLFGQDQMLEFVMQYGEQALKAIEQMMKNPQDENHSKLLEQMLKDGMIDKDGKGKIRLTPRAITRMQHRALMEVFANLRQGQRDGHERVTPGSGGERIDGTKPYQYGDPVSELDLHQTLHNALARTRGEGAQQPAGGGQKGQTNSARIEFAERDFELHQHEGTTSCSTVVLLDMSGSMMRYGRFHSAKRVAMAMQALVRSRFPQDSIDFVGFYSGAQRISESSVPLMMPKPVTVFDHRVRLKVPINMLDRAPQHFTNLHMGLQLARRILRQRASENKQLFIITDGEPTAHVEGDHVYLLYPPDKRSTVATLKEAVMASREGCRISTFALIEDYWGMDWVGFVDQLTKLIKGVAFYTSSGELSDCIMESYLSGRKKKTHVG